MFKTEQEKFWAENFGNEYIQRNQGAELLASNLNFFTKALAHEGKLNSCIEFGANIGMNLRAIRLLFPSIQTKAIEINPAAAAELKSWMGEENVVSQPVQACRYRFC